MTKFNSITRYAAVVIMLGSIGGLSMINSEEWGPAKSAYDDYITRPSLQMRTRGRIGLASSRHPGAFKILSESYAKPEDPEDQVKYLLASICGNYFGDEEFTEGWTAWREKYQSKEDAWLWYRSLLHHMDNRGEADLFKIASEHKQVFIRMAALEALSDNASDEMLAWWEKTLADAEDWKGIDRVLYLETAAKSLYEAAASLGDDQFRKTALLLIPEIENKKTDYRTRIVMARYFREIFGGEKLYINAKPWLDKLLNPEKPASSSDKYADVPPPTKFVGIEAAGKRIVYVIDMSDSMCMPLSKDAKEKLKKPPEPKRRGPVTGEKRPPGGDEPDEEAEEEEEDLEDALPWDKINTRFDAAREYLKLSLRSLQPDQSFCVIWFGTEADTLKSTKSLVPASSGAVEKVCRELDKIDIGDPTTDRKHGTLRGNTNLHGGIHRAFKLRKGKMVKEYEYVDADTFFSGADTIFVLSDGDPTWDDWAINDQRDPFDQTGDPESRTKHPDQEILEFPGPYGYMYQNEYLPDDVRRMNLFRKCEIHCIGIGEVSYSLLAAIARAGNGQVKMVGG